MHKLSKSTASLNRMVDREIDFHVLYSTFANNVKYIRKDLCLTQQQLADLLEVKRCKIGAIEEGRSLDIRNIMLIAKLAKVSIDTLIKTDMRVPHKVKKPLSEFMLNAS